MTARDVPVLHTGRVVINLMNVLKESQTARNLTDRPGKTLHMVRARGVKGDLLSIHPDWPRASSRIHDNYCVNVLKTGLLAGSQETVNYVQLPETRSLKTMNIQTSKTSLVNCFVVNPVLFAKGHSQKKDITPVIVNCHKTELKYVKDVSCVDQLSFVRPVTNVPTDAIDLPVGARLQQFWQTWIDLGAGPKVSRILKQGYILPFQIRPNLTRSPTVISYANPHRNLYLFEALHQLMNKIQ